MIKTSNKKLKRSLSTIILYYVLMITSFLLIYFSVYLEFDYLGRYIWLKYTCIILFCLSLLFNLIVAMSDPGHLQRDESLNFIDLVEEFDPSCLCEHCKLIKSPRAKHCALCNRCADRYDHHCPWINNCIGRGNIKRFYAFLLTQIFYLFMTIIACSLCK